LAVRRGPHGAVADLRLDQVQPRLFQLIRVVGGLELGLAGIDVGPELDLHLLLRVFHEHHAPQLRHLPVGDRLLLGEFVRLELLLGDVALLEQLALLDPPLRVEGAALGLLGDGLGGVQLRQVDLIRALLVLLKGLLGGLVVAFRLDSLGVRVLDHALLLQLIVLQGRGIELANHLAEDQVVQFLRDVVDGGNLEPAKLAVLLVNAVIEDALLPLLPHQRPPNVGALGHDLEDPRAGHVLRLHVAADLDVAGALDGALLRDVVHEVAPLDDVQHGEVALRRARQARNELPRDGRDDHQRRHEHNENAGHEARTTRSRGLVPFHPLHRFDPLPLEF